MHSILILLEVFTKIRKRFFILVNLFYFILAKYVHYVKTKKFFKKADKFIIHNRGALAQYSVFIINIIKIF